MFVQFIEIGFMKTISILSPTPLKPLLILFSNLL
jgi:hypothetical protein